MKCSVCGKEAIISLPVYKKTLCPEHYSQWYYEKTKEFTKKLTSPGDKIALAISGGKDSVALAIFFSRYIQEFDVNVFLFHIDLGIPKYSELARREVEKVARKLGIDLEIYSLEEELGVSLLDLNRGPRPPCSVCGVVKRYLMNRIPRELGATKLATGHNLDDNIENFFKNWTSGNFEWLAKQKPILPGTHPKLLTRIKPLFERTGEENLAYLVANGFKPFEHKCPFSKTGKWRLLAEELERKNPGFKLALAKSLERFDYPVKSQELKECKICGEPTSVEVCAFCKLTGQNLNPT